MIATPTFRLGRPMGATEMCDRCGGRATVLALLFNGGKLLFCGHHARLHFLALSQVAECFEDPASRARHAVLGYT